MSERRPLLEVSGLCKAYAGVRRRIEVLRGLDLAVDAGEAIAVVGDSGVGKSTLLHVLGGLDQPDAGAIRFRGEDLLARSAAGLAEYRNRSIGFVFQFHHLLPEFSALENVEMPFRIGRRTEAAAELARTTLQRLGLEERVDHRPAALSGGEQQRVAIARALAPGPEMVLADEPTGNLDSHTGQEIHALLVELNRERGTTMLVVTHNPELAGMMPRRLRMIDGGKLVDADTASPPPTSARRRATRRSTTPRPSSPKTSSS
jgi:lipoprotein-releasing system ATP-binding protein